MKNYIKRLLIVAFGSILFVGCEDAPLQIFETPEGFIQMVSSTGSVNENSATEFVSTVVFGGPTTTSDITVNYTVTSSDPSRYTVNPSSGSVTIPAGEFTADIAIQPIDNFDVDGDVQVTIALSADSSKPIGIGGEGLVSASKVVTIIDNDCPIDIASFVGTYSVFENFTAGVNSPSGLNNFFNESYQMEMALDPADISGTKVVLTNSAGFDTYINDGTIMSFDTCNGRVSFDAGFPTVALFRTFEYTASSYNENTFVIQCTGPLSTFGEYQFTLTKQ